MSRALAKLTPKPPKELASLFADPPLVGDESREDYEKLFSAIAAAAKPADAIGWIYVRDFVDLTWEIRRERWLKHRTIEHARQAVVIELLLRRPSPFSSELLPSSSGERDLTGSDAESILEDLKQWETDPRARRRIEKRLADEGNDTASILTAALIESAPKIDAIDKRISAYECRRNVILREIDRHSESMARRLEQATSDIIDGEFTEAAE